MDMLDSKRTFLISKISNYKFMLDYHARLADEAVLFFNKSSIGGASPDDMQIITEHYEMCCKQRLICAAFLEEEKTTLIDFDEFINCVRS